MIEVNKKDVNIILIGVGGTGSHLISFLSQLIGNDTELLSRSRITLVDGDIVELKNLRTQKFLESDVGKNKAEVLSERYQSVFNLDISYVDSFITDIEDIYRLHNHCELNIVVSAVDNNNARAIIDKSFNKKGYYGSYIYIDTGNSSGQEELTGQTVIGYRDCHEIILDSVSKYYPDILVPEVDDDDEELSCVEQMNRNMQNIGANITSACTVFNMLNSILSKQIIPGSMFTFNATHIEATNYSNIASQKAA